MHGHLITRQLIYPPVTGCAALCMTLPKNLSLKRTLQRKRRDLQTASDSTSLPPPPTDTIFIIVPQLFQHMILHDSGSGNDRLAIVGRNELLDGLAARAKLWLANGTFKVVQCFFQLYSIHFERVPGLIPAAVYCLVQSKTRATYEIASCRRD